MLTHDRCHKFEEEIERLKNENKILKEVLISIACFDNPELETREYWINNSTPEKMITTLINDTEMAREVLRRVSNAKLS